MAKTLIPLALLLTTVLAWRPVAAEAAQATPRASTDAGTTVAAAVAAAAAAEPAAGPAAPIKLQPEIPVAAPAAPAAQPVTVPAIATAAAPVAGPPIPVPIVPGPLTLVPLFDHGIAGDVLSWRIQGAPRPWMSLDETRTPTLVIVSPDQSTVRRSAFVYQEFAPDPAHDADGAKPAYLPKGPQVLEVRDTVRVPGEQHWTLLGPDGRELAKGAFVVGPATGPLGPIRVSHDNPRLLSFADGTVFIPLGPNVAWANVPRPLDGFDRYFAALEAAHGNHCRVWCASWSCQIEGNTPDAYRLDQAWLLDQVLASARRHHLHVTLVLDNHFDFGYGKCCPYGPDLTSRIADFLAPTPPAQYERRLRYILARYGMDDTILAWELFNELDLACHDRAISKAWIAGASKTLKALDQDHRLRTVSWSSDDWYRVEDAPDIDLVQSRGYVLEYIPVNYALKKSSRDGVAMLIPAADRANHLSRPFCFGEVGYQGSEQANPGDDADPTGLLMMQQAWAGFMLGGYGSSLNWWWDVYIDKNHLWPIYTGMARILGQVDWRERDLTPLAPSQGSPLRVIGWVGRDQGLVWPQLVADTWYDDLVLHHSRIGAPTPFLLRFPAVAPASRFIVTWLDMRSGKVLKQDTIGSGRDGSLAIPIPARDIDIVVLFRRRN